MRIVGCRLVYAYPLWYSYGTNRGNTMSDHFRKITRYECIWCGSIFKTDNKHRCKFNPDYRNCYSCRYCDGIESMESTYSVPFAAHENASAVLKNIVDTETLKKIACRKGHAVYTRDIALKKNEYMCPDHEIMENYEGKKSYYQIAVLNKIDFRKYEEDNIDALTGRTWAEED